MRKFLIAFFLMASITSFSQQFYLFTGTYTGSGSKGIYLYKFDASNGTITPVSVTENVENPSYLAIHPNQKVIYAVNETGGDKPGEVSAFSFDKKSGKLTFLNKQKTDGDHPCYVAVDKTGKWVIEPQFEGIRDFKNGYAAAKKGGKWGVINKEGKWIIEPKFEGIKDMERVTAK